MIRKLVLTYSLLVSPVIAELQTADLYETGDALLTLDTSTDIEWLDLVVTDNYSFDEISALLAPGQPLEGFRYAVGSDLDVLQQSAGLPSGIDIFMTIHSVVEKANALIGLLGITDESSTTWTSIGLTGEDSSVAEWKSLRLILVAKSGSYFRITQGGVSAHDPAYFIGSFLIRNRPPEGNSLIADGDRDGMPDGWEYSFGLNTFTNDALADLDQDGSSNIDEYIAGTNPTNAASYFRVSVSPEEQTFTWNSAAGRIYDVLSCSDLRAADWTTVESNQAYTVNIMTNTLSTNGEFRYYRVRTRIHGQP